MSGDILASVVCCCIYLLTIAATFMVMRYFQITLERISLGALILALGMLVDNAIVVVDGMKVRMERGMDGLKAAREVVGQNSIPLLGATVVAVLAFASIGGMDNSTGEYCRSLYYVILISLSLSWLTAVTVTPLVTKAFVLGKKSRQQDGEQKDPYGGKFYEIYRGLLKLAIRMRVVTILIVCGMFGLSLYGFGFVSNQFFPNSTTPQFISEAQFREGTYIRETEKGVAAMEEHLLSLDGVTQVAAAVGAGHPRFLLVYAVPVDASTHYTNIVVTVEDYRMLEEMLPQVQRDFEEMFPDVVVNTKKFLLGPGEGGKIQLRINGPDPVELRKMGDQAMAIVAEDPVSQAIRTEWGEKLKLPQPLIAEDRARSLGIDRAALSQGTSPEKALIGTISVSQQIYSESSWAGYSVEKSLQTGREFDRDSVKLDIMYASSTAYLDVLRRRTIEQLQKDNMQLTQANLERAQIRLSTGVAGPDELYRWQTKFANDRQVVLRAESASIDSMQALNRILNRPLLEEFVAEETDLSDPLLIGGDRLFYELIHNPLYFKKFNEFAVQEGLNLSPELKVIDSAMAAQERIILKSRRDYWVPTLSIDGNLDYLFSDSGEGQRQKEITGLDDSDWQVGVFARLPLVEGGRKSATLGRNREQLIQLQTERMATTERIGQRILQSLNNNRASYPSINLSRDAVDAARRNLQLVTDSYVQGIKSIIDLLDAQNQALNAELDAANAVYNFLIDFMGVQRSIGTFFTFLPSDDRELWIKQVKEHIQST